MTRDSSAWRPGNKRWRVASGPWSGLLGSDLRRRSVSCGGTTSSGLPRPPCTGADETSSVEEDYGEAGFAISGKPDAIQRGRHWNANLTPPGVPPGTDPEAVWARLKPTLVRGGWTVLSDPAGREKVARYQKDGHDTWFGLWILSAEDMRLDLVDVGPPNLKMKLNPPAAKPEVVSVRTGDFPYFRFWHTMANPQGVPKSEFAPRIAAPTHATSAMCTKCPIDRPPAHLGPSAFSPASPGARVWTIDGERAPAHADVHEVPY
jgi:hypothetical protein